MGPSNEYTTLPDSERSLLLRTDFADAPAWQALCATLQQPASLFEADIELVSDPAFAGFDPAQLTARATRGPYRAFLFVVDQTTLSHPENPLVVLDLVDEPGRFFRVIPAELAAVENNLSLANMDFFEFADAVDADGIFRGFADCPTTYQAPDGVGTTYPCTHK